MCARFAEAPAVDEAWLCLTLLGVPASSQSGGRACVVVCAVTLLQQSGARLGLQVRRHLHPLPTTRFRSRESPRQRGCVSPCPSPLSAYSSLTAGATSTPPGDSQGGAAYLLRVTTQPPGVPEVAGECGSFSSRVPPGVSPGNTVCQCTALLPGVPKVAGACACLFPAGDTACTA